MRVLVVGATGVIGRATVRALAGADHRVTGLVRREPDGHVVRREGGTPVLGDLLDPATLLECVKEVDCVVHAATAIPKKFLPTRSDWKTNDRVRRDGTSNLIDVAVEAPNRPFVVHTSVYLVYGNDCGNRLLDEDSELSPPSAIKTAVDAERLVRAAGDDHDLACVILRPGWLYSARAWHTQHLIRSLQDGAAAVLDDAPAWRSPVHADDVARAIQCCVEQQPSGMVFNVADEEPVKYETLLDGLATRLRASPPERLSRLQAEMRFGPTGLSILARSVRLSTKGISTALGYRPRHVSWREGFSSIFGEGSV